MPKIVNKSEDQETAEGEVERFQDDLGPFVVAAETTRMAMVFTDACETDNPIIFANDAFLNMTGYERVEVLGQSFNFLMAHIADQDALALIREALENHSDTNTDPEILYRRKDGSEFWAALFVSPIRDDDGDIIQNFASFVDLTAYKNEQAQSRMLIDELNHRVKNTLATVQSIVSQAARANADPQAMKNAVETRLYALSRSHDLLTREKWHSAGLLDVIHDALEPFGATDVRARRVKITGDNIRFGPKPALALGIAFNELATNAMKYGAFSNENGSIRIKWTIEPSPTGRRLRLIWTEKDGPAVTPPTRKGFGSQVIERGLAHELDGTVGLDYRAEGVVCAMDIPAPVSDDE
ncbi:PAS domain-containing protein [Loktanella salsilacus]|uniref:HWE histidine kinase domain-containing protein n=1 Tax=Loktanella salsilacus TaxID=195913 RepID=UPI0020B84E08|nr:HWE histidine kinase domain-containing protein [Loktanella salsilacus]UTH49368.1 PAS domain-containing protein [Loktanella salsilacus]